MRKRASASSLLCTLPISSITSTLHFVSLLIIALAVVVEPKELACFMASTTDTLSLYVLPHSRSKEQARCVFPVPEEPSKTKTPLFPHLTFCIKDFVRFNSRVLSAVFVAKVEKLSLKYRCGTPVRSKRFWAYLASCSFIRRSISLSCASASSLL